MKRACILILIIVSLLACKKEPELKTYVLEITKVEVETGTTTAYIHATYSYPAELKSVYLKISNNSDMSASDNYPAIIDGNTLTVELNDLNVSTKYYYCFEYNNGVSQATTSILNFITADYYLPIVNTKEVTSITATSAECGGVITDDGGATITARGVCWSTNHNPTTNNNHTDDDSGLGEFTSSITGLETNITYYVRAYATNSKGTSYGEERSFTTQEGLAAITTNAVTNITATTAISGGNITDDGGFSITARGVCWSTMHNPTTTNNHTSDGFGLGEFSSSLTGLETNVTYYVRAYAINSKGTTYGQERSFTTQDGLAIIATSEITNITTTSAVSGGNITDDGGYSITVRGVCWSTSQNPTTNNYYTTDGSGTGSFISNLSGLTYNTTYYIRAYATNNKGTSYGEERFFTTNKLPPTIATNEVSSITATSAVCGGEVISDGGASITARGVCYSTAPNPTINNNHTSNGNGTGSFVSNLTGLLPNTTYYVKAYATNSIGTSYGEQKTFTTEIDYPTITTTAVTNVTTTSALSGGNITSDGGSAITARGVCWSTNPNPTINDFYTIDGIGTGAFISNITDLSSNTTYYVRAYATNGLGTAYGTQLSFRTAIIVPEGAINGLFSINANQQIWFSKGNLQYIGSASTPYWKFADNQWDFFETYGNSNSFPNSDRDLFAWGTSGFDHGAICYQPWSNSTSDSDFYAYGNVSYNLYNQSGQADWGYNSINNGGNEPNIWRTLTTQEWNYIFNIRNTPSGYRFALAKVNGFNGVIIFPDSWDASIYTIYGINNNNANYESNSINANTWNSIFQTQGAVFLPVAGYCYPSGNYTVGYYWSSSVNNEYSVFCININNYIYCNSQGSRYYRMSVRLVQDYNGK